MMSRDEEMKKLGEIATGSVNESYNRLSSDAEISLGYIMRKKHTMDQNPVKISREKLGGGISN